MAGNSEERTNVAASLNQSKQLSSLDKTMADIKAKLKVAKISKEAPYSQRREVFPNDN
jgi:hypothetical protein